MWSPEESEAFSDPFADQNGAGRSDDLFAASAGHTPGKNRASTGGTMMRAALVSPDAADDCYGDDSDGGYQHQQHQQHRAQTHTRNLKYRPRVAQHHQHLAAKHHQGHGATHAASEDTATAPTAPISPMTRSQSTRSGGGGGVRGRAREDEVVVDDDVPVDEVGERDHHQDDEEGMEVGMGGATFAAAHPQTPRSAQPPSHLSPQAAESSVRSPAASPRSAVARSPPGGLQLQDASSFDSDLVASSPADALALSRLGPERTILKLRRQLDQYQGQSSSAKSALAKSDAVILELRRTVRELRGELSRAEGQRDESRREAREGKVGEEEARREMERTKNRVAGRERQLLELQAQLAGADGTDELVGELQLKLDRAHAQILTSDMRLREREDEYSRKLHELESRMSDALRKRDAELDELRGECDDLTGHIQRRDDEVAELETRCRDAEEQFQEAVEELELAQGEIDEAHRQLERREDEGDAEMDELEGRVAELEIQLKNAKMTVEDREEEIRRLEDGTATEADLDKTAASDPTVNLSDLADRALLNDRLTEKDAEIAALRRRLELAQDALDSHAQSGLEEVSPQRARVELEKELEETAVKFGTAEMELAEANMKLHESEGRVRELQAELDGVISKMGDGGGGNASGSSANADSDAEDSKERLDRITAERDALEKERDTLQEELEEVTRDCLKQLQENHEHIHKVLCSPDLKEAAAALESAEAAEAAAMLTGEGQAEEKKDGAADWNPRGSPLHVHFEKNSPSSEQERKRMGEAERNDDSFTRASDYRYLADELRDQLDVAKDEIRNLREQLRLLEASSARRRIEREERLNRSPRDVYDEVVQLRMRLAEFEADRDRIEAKERALKDVYDKQRTVEAKTRGLSEVYRAQKELESKVAALKKENAGIDRARLSALSEKDDLKAKMDKLANDAGELAEHVEALEKERDDLAERRVALEETAEKLRGQIQLLEKERDGRHDTVRDAKELEKEKASLAAGNAELAAAKKELEGKLSELNSQIKSLTEDKSELQQNLEDAMAELELADEEVQQAQAAAAASSSSNSGAHAELEQKAEGLERKAADLRKELESRDSEIVRLRARLMEKDDERIAAASASVRAASLSRSASKSPARRRIQERREASESKLREQLGHVATWLDERDSGGKKTREASAPSKADESADGGENGNGEVVSSTHVHLEKLKRKLFTTEEELEETRKELEVVQRRPLASPQRVSELEEAASRLEDSLRDEKSRAARLERELSAAKADAKKKEETCVDLRKSLKEAVALLKPLKEHVAKSEGEKEVLKRELEEERMKQQLPPSPSMGGSGDEDALRKRVEELEAELADAAESLTEQEKLAAELSDEADRLDDELQETHAELVDVREQLAAAAAAAAITKGSEVALASKQATKQSSSEEGDVKLREARSDLERARDDLRERESAGAKLEESLAEAREKLNELSDRHAQVTEERDEMKRQLEAAKEDLAELEEILSDKDDALREASERLDSALADGERADELRAEVDTLRKKLREQEAELHQQDGEVAKLNEELQLAQNCIANITDGRVPSHAAPSDLSQRTASWKASNDGRIKEVESLRDAIRESNARVTELEEELSSARRDVRKKDKSEKVLNKSLKEAVALLKPLQKHVETAEAEKVELRRKLVVAQKRAEAAENSTPAGRNDDADRTSLTQLEREKAELERRVANLEREKAMDEFADGLSPSGDDESRRQRSIRSEGHNQQQEDAGRLKERLAEMSSRYEVTKKMLDEAAETNASLLEDLKQMEQEEEEAVEEADALRTRLRQMEEELENAKYIATSALVKVEEMSMQGGSGSPVGGANGSDHASLSRRSGGRGVDLEGIAEDEGGDKFRSSIRSLEEEVRIAKEKNAALERAIREKDELLSRHMGGGDGDASSTGGTISLGDSDGESRSRQSNGRGGTGAFKGSFRQGPRYIG